MDNICLVCCQNPKRNKYQFCSKYCMNWAVSTAPMLLQVPSNHVMYRDGRTPRKSSAFAVRAIKTGFKTTLHYKHSMPLMQRYPIRQANCFDRSGVRFGRGIYMAASSSKAIQYAQNGDPRSKYEAILVTRVVLGNPQLVCKEDHRREQPDTPYHSVEAHPENSGPIEDVVYNHNAVHLAYLIIVKQ
ncbi:hypothetical protein EDD18DRAFT_1105485 [Armillaria luteobubalina]|uniref:PARP catalytic domain-containing protein n=1 Tax=Armillaria luteobubalina TaxID=153913 RepID=A0AA39Q4Y8_9AGAR|nr:hypothetical protein EDD18DRAFT_1105485 [Armillaria luteobubalina]